MTPANAALSPKDLSLLKDDPKPIGVEQGKTRPLLTAFIKKFTKDYPGFSRAANVNRKRVEEEAIAMIPESLRKRARTAGFLKTVSGIVHALPEGPGTEVYLRLSIIGEGQALAALPPLSQPEETAILANFPVDEGVLRQYTVPAAAELSSLEDVALKSGMVLVCQRVSPLINPSKDNHKLIPSRGPVSYGTRNRDPFVPGNDMPDDPKYLDEKPSEAQANRINPQNPKPYMRYPVFEEKRPEYIDHSEVIRIAIEAAIASRIYEKLAGEKERARQIIGEVKELVHREVEEAKATNKPLSMQRITAAISNGLSHMGAEALLAESEIRAFVQEAQSRAVAAEMPAGADVPPNVFPYYAQEQGVGHIENVATRAEGAILDQARDESLRIERSKQENAEEGTSSKTNAPIQQVETSFVLLPPGTLPFRITQGPLPPANADIEGDLAEDKPLVLPLGTTVSQGVSGVDSPIDQPSASNYSFIEGEIANEEAAADAAAEIGEPAKPQEGYVDSADASLQATTYGHAVEETTLPSAAGEVVPPVEQSLELARGGTTQTQQVINEEELVNNQAISSSPSGTSLDAPSSGTETAKTTTGQSQVLPEDQTANLDLAEQSSRGVTEPAGSSPPQAQEIQAQAAQEALQTQASQSQGETPAQEVSTTKGQEQDTSAQQAPAAPERPQSAEPASQAAQSQTSATETPPQSGQEGTSFTQPSSSTAESQSTPQTPTGGETASQNGNGATNEVSSRDPNEHGGLQDTSDAEKAENLNEISDRSIEATEKSRDNMESLADQHGANSQNAESIDRFSDQSEREGLTRQERLTDQASPVHSEEQLRNGHEGNSLSPTDKDQSNIAQANNLATHIAGDTIIHTASVPQAGMAEHAAHHIATHMMEQAMVHTPHMASMATADPSSLGGMPQHLIREATLAPIAGAALIKTRHRAEKKAAATPISKVSKRVLSPKKIAKVKVAAAKKIHLNPDDFDQLTPGK